MKQTVRKKKEKPMRVETLVVDCYGVDIGHIIMARLDHHVKRHNANLKRYLRAYSRGKRPKR